MLCWRYVMAATPRRGIWRLKTGGFFVSSRVTDSRTGKRYQCARALRDPNVTIWDAVRVRDQLRYEGRPKEHDAMFIPDTDCISSYTRAQAIEDGVLVDVTPMAREAGLKYPVALTQAAWALCVVLSPAAERACNDQTGRLWDVLWMLRVAAQRARAGASEIVFAIRCVTTNVTPSRVAPRALVGPGDEGGPVITVMLPDES